jgi:small subunit ribosomal protein S13
MARLLGVEIPNEKRIDASLPYIYGIGRSLALKVLAETGVDPSTRTGELTDDQLAEISHVVTGKKIVVEGDLRREISIHLKRLSSINCYRGVRHRRGMPVRGQRTHTNARTRKGKRKTVGVQRSK